jgi:hypothetical protein
MDMPPPDQLQPLFMRHFLALGWISDAPSDTKLKLVDSSRLQYISGFVVSFSGEWLLLTAGHAVEAINSILDAGYRLESASLYDAWCGGRFKSSIPFTYNPKMTIFQNCDDGVDFGIIHLSSIYQKLLTSNGVTPFSEFDWESQPEQFDAYYLLGMPYELGRLPRGAGEKRDFTVIVEAALLEVERVEAEAVPANFRRSSPSLYGRLINEAWPKEINGMSGGPIFGIRGDKYWPVGIQSEWLPDSRIIRATPVSLFGRRLRSWIELLGIEGSSSPG